MVSRLRPAVTGECTALAALVPGLGVDKMSLAGGEMTAAFHNVVLISETLGIKAGHHEECVEVCNEVRVKCATHEWLVHCLGLAHQKSSPYVCRPLKLNPCRHELSTITAPANCSAGCEYSMSTMLAEARKGPTAVAAAILFHLVT
jgi:hypothetical protein